MASNYIQVVTQNERSNELLRLIDDTLSVSQRLTQTKNEMDAIMGSSPVVYDNLIAKYGVADVAAATALYNMVVSAKTAVDAAGVTSFTKNIGL